MNMVVGVDMIRALPMTMVMIRSMVIHPGKDTREKTPRVKDPGRAGQGEVGAMRFFRFVLVFDEEW